MTASSTTPGALEADGSAFTFTATLKSGESNVKLRWSGASGDRIDILVNSVKVRSTTNDGGTAHKLAGPGTYGFQLCEQVAPACSNIETVSYGTPPPDTAPPPNPTAPPPPPDTAAPEPGQRTAPPPAASGPGIWLSPAEIAKLPTSGAAWNNVKKAADTNLRGGDLTTRDDHNTRTMAAALVAARLDDNAYRSKVGDALRDVMNASVNRDDVLAAARRLGTYAISADLINLAGYDPALNAEFVAWLRQMRDLQFSGGGGGGSVVSVHEKRPNNFGTHAGASRMAVDLYIGDAADFKRAAAVFKGWLGDRSSYTGFDYGDLSWQCDPSQPIGINPQGCTKNGQPIDGVLPDDQRRSGGFTWSAPKEGYVWEAMQGTIVATAILERQGYPAAEWSDRAVLRALRWLYDVNNYPAEGDDEWIPHLANDLFGTSFPARDAAGPGKNMGWTDWTH